MMEFFVQNGVKASALLLAAFAASWMLRNRTAALRHYIWTVALSTLLVLPLLTAVIPRWGWRAMPEVRTVVTVRQTMGPIVHTSAPPPSRSMPQLWLPLLWTLGFLVVAVRFAIGAARTARMARGALPAAHAAGLGIETRTPLLESPDIPMPLACGILRPAVILPVASRDWTVARLRTVVLHELMHVERRDLLAQAAGHAACCLYWFHPLVWLAARQLRKERERACDDAVLLLGVPAHEYAAHLVDLVRAMATRKAQWAGVAGMAERSDLESRVRALLDRRRARQPLGRLAAFAVGAASLAVLLPLAALTTYAQADRGGIVGIVKDPSGAVIPNCAITAKNLDGSNEESATCNPVGEYRFGAVPPGRYELTVQVRGFAMRKLSTIVSAGAVNRVDAAMEIGMISSAVEIRAQKPAAAPLARPVSAGTPQRVRVGGNVQVARLISQQKPVYPEDAMQQGVEGVVMMKAIISKTGQVLSPRVINTDVDPRLAKAALDAVSQWTYQPVLLNGEPVESLTQIDLAFKLNQ